MALLDKSFGTEASTVTLSVESRFEGMRLDQFLQEEHFHTLSRQIIKRMIDHGQVIIEGRTPPHKPSVKVHEGEIITATMIQTSHEDEFWHGKKLELQTIPEIVYEDDGLIVISKPAFMTAHPVGRHIFNTATTYFEAVYKKTVHCVHRLDRETSGILLLAKNYEVAKAMNINFEFDHVKKVYFFIARVAPHFKGENSFTVFERLRLRSEVDRERMDVEAFPQNSPLGREAETHFELLYHEKDYMLGLAFPRTGRQHQIRVHAAHHGLPLIGDKMYLGGYEMFQRFKDVLASDEDHALMELPRQALHATALKLPYLGKETIFKSHIPLDFREWITTKLSIDLGALEKMIEQKIKIYFEEAAPPIQQSPHHSVSPSSKSALF